MKKIVIISLIVVLLALAGVSAVFAATGWFSTSIPVTGTINITTTTTQPPATNFNYTLSPNIDFGSSNTFAADAPVSVTGTVINSLAVAGMNLPSWITTVSVTQTPVPVGAAQQETVTLSGTAPSTSQTINLVGPNALRSGEITITPGS
jgi:hypothetical protein